MPIVGAQDRPPQWHIGYLKLKSLEKQQEQKDLSDSVSSNAGNKSP